MLEQMMFGALVSLFIVSLLALVIDMILVWLYRPENEKTHHNTITLSAFWVLVSAIALYINW